MDINTENYERSGAQGVIRWKFLFTIDGWYVVARGANFPLQRGRDTVTTGKFVPGEYRVNPYHTIGGQVTVKDGDPERKRFASTLPSAISDYAQGQPLYSHREGGGGYLTEYFVLGDWWKYQFYYQADNAAPLLDQESSHRQLALQKCYAKLDSFDLDIGTVLGEYRETIAMLRSPFKSLRTFLFKANGRNWRLLLALAKGDRHKVTKILGKKAVVSADTMASTWLELRYGLRPMVYLIQDVIERVNAKQKAVLDPDLIRTVRSRMEFGPYYTRTTQSATYNECCVKSDVLVEDLYASNASVAYKLTEESCKSDTLGLTPRFLPELAWELTRLSFVVDWFFSVGAWLGTLRVKPHVEVLGNTSGYKVNRTLRLIDPRIGKSGTSGQPIHVITGATGEDDVKSKEDSIVIAKYQRTVDEQLQWYPHFTWARTFDLYKTIDSVALIWQFAKTKK